jgi:hypothetical protein
MAEHHADQTSSKTTRRDFIKTASAAAVTAAVGPTILHAADKAGSKQARVGEGAFQYECTHGWGEVPDHIVWGVTHGVTIDEEGLVYIKHRSAAKGPMDAIAVFDQKGKFVHSFGKEYHGGGHGIDIRKEGNQEFLYLSDTKHGIVVKTTLKGEQIWKIGRPDTPEAYKNPKNRYSPTNLCFAPDGGFYVGDGYGSHYIHKYDKKGEFEFSWGGEGSEPGKMKTPHGIWLDDRGDGEPTIVVADRANARLQYFDLKGKHLSFVDGLSFPADIDIQGDIMLVPDLHARITLFDKDNKVITHFGYDAEWTKKALANKFEMRSNPKMWRDGRFIHPHDACFDQAGNIYVTEWVATGRVSFLRKVS